MNSCSNIRNLLAIVCILFPLSISAQQKLTRYVDPFVGTGGHGHTFPGATMPFGMVQLSPDTRLTGWDGCSGYHYSDNIIYGFSHTHLSGTGISDYGDILLMPSIGIPYLNALNGTDTSKGYASRFDHRNETAQPGYYSVRLDDDDVRVELTVTRRAGMHRYTYPATKAANIILDLAHRDKVIDSGFRITGPTTVVGWRRSQAWANDQVVYFAAEFSQPFTASSNYSTEDMIQAHPQGDRDLKAFFQFDASSGAPILVKVGISATSIEGARKNLDAEIKGWDFDGVRQAALQAWENELRRIEVSGGSEAQLKNFYTALYHSMTAPNLFMDIDGQYRGRDFKNHQASGFENYTVFSLWDTFRAAHPLYTIIDQQRTRDFINTFLAQYEQGGRLPVWELAANETDTMIGYHAVSVIADAAAKGIRGFDLQKALEAMKHSAEADHFGLRGYKNRGYLEMEEERESVSKTLEYAYDDWCIAEFARLLGRTDDYHHYLRRAQSYENLFDRESGFMRPRSNGGWSTPFEPREVSFSFTEANSWQYSFFVPQDISGLIDLMGGRRRFANKLDALFFAPSQTVGREQADITGLIGQYAHGNEPSHHMAYLYNYARVPWKTQARVRQILNRFYSPTPDGLIGNEDCGQMSAWYVLSAAGFYSVTPGSPIYAIGTPLFPVVRFNLENGKHFVIKAHGVSDRNFYIQSARLNGKRYTKSYLTHNTLMEGGELVFEMGSAPNKSWGTRTGDIPVSAISGEHIIAAPVIRASGKTFKDQTTVSIDFAGNASTNSKIYYTVDGSQPSAQSKNYIGAFPLDRTGTIKAVVIDSTGNKSSVTTATHYRVPHDRSLKLDSSYSNQYPGGGASALIDGIRGTTNWTGGAWQGYQGVDVVALVDLHQVTTVHSLGAGFLQDIGSWIWMPRRVEFEVSRDGNTFDRVLSIANDIDDGSKGSAGGVVIKNFEGKIAPTAARYIRVRAVNYGTIPSWHPGHGGQAWIFADEIWIN